MSVELETKLAELEQRLTAAEARAHAAEEQAERLREATRQDREASQQSRSTQNDRASDSVTSRADATKQNIEALRAEQAKLEHAAGGAHRIARSPHFVRYSALSKQIKALEQDLSRQVPARTFVESSDIKDVSLRVRYEHSLRQVLSARREAQADPTNGQRAITLQFAETELDAIVGRVFAREGKKLRGVDDL